MPTPESGKGGKVALASTSIGEILTWRIRKKAIIDKWGSSESAGYGKGVTGRKDATIEFDGKFDSAAVIGTLEGASVTLQLYLNATEFFSVPALMGTCDVTCDINEGKATTISCTAESTGTYVEPTLN